MADAAVFNLAAVTVLKNSEWFKDMSDELLREIAALSSQRRYGEGELVFARDTPGDYLYGVIAGSIRVTTMATDGRELSLNTMRAGDVIGEIAVLDGGVRTASGHALEPTTVFLVPREQFTALMLRQPSIALHMIRLLCERVRRTSRQVEEAAFLSLKQRLAQQLKKLVEDHGSELPCTIKISQAELASFLNASRQAVNGCLQEWARLDLLTLQRGRITVHDLAQILATA